MSDAVMNELCGKAAKCEYQGETYSLRRIWELIDALYENGVYASLSVSEGSEFEPDCKWQVTLDVTDGERYGDNPAYCEYKTFGEGDTAFEALAEAVGKLR